MFSGVWEGLGRYSDDPGLVELLMRNGWSRRLAGAFSGDPGLMNLKAAVRVAVVAPMLLAVTDLVGGDVRLSLFAWFGSYVLLEFVEFTGPASARMMAYVAFALGTVPLLVIGTLSSRSAWLAVPATALVAWAVLFSGVFNAYFAVAGQATLMAFVLAVMTPGPASAIPERLVGWGIAMLAAVTTAMVLWTERPPTRLRAALAQACRSMADGVAWMTTPSAWSDGTGTEDIHPIWTDVFHLRRRFVETAHRPSGVGGRTAALGHLVVDVNWLVPFAEPRADRDGLAAVCFRREATEIHAAVSATLTAAADRLDRGPRTGGPLGLDRLERAERGMRTALLDYIERSGQRLVPDVAVPAARSAHQSADSDTTGSELPPADLALAEAFRLRRLARGTRELAVNVLRVTAPAPSPCSWMRPRGWSDRLSGLTRRGVAATDLAAGYASLRSVWFRNSVRGAVGLALAVAVAQNIEVQHGLWVALGTLSVLRSNVAATSSTILRGLLGTGIGILVGGLFVVLVGAHTVVSWLVLPLAMFVAGYLRRKPSFVLGQAGFTVAILILFNILEPSGWQVGLVRIQDTMIGFGVSLAVGALLWPRGAATLIRRRAAAAFRTGADFLALVVMRAPGDDDPPSARPRTSPWLYPPYTGISGYSGSSVDTAALPASQVDTPARTGNTDTALPDGGDDGTVCRPRRDEHIAAAARDALRAGRLLDDVVRQYLSEQPNDRVDVDALMTIVGGALRLRRTAQLLRAGDVPWPADILRTGGDVSATASTMEISAMLPDLAAAQEAVRSETVELCAWYRRLAEALDDGRPPLPADPNPGPGPASTAALAVVRRGATARRRPEVRAGVALAARATYLDILWDLRPMLTDAGTALAHRPGRPWSSRRRTAEGRGAADGPRLAPNVQRARG
nr:FUSC family protein [Parafrankia sp. EUN1f]